MQRNDMFSIVVPTFNRAHVAGLAVESLLAQAASVPCEVIVVDNGSTDGTRARIERLAEQAAGRPRYVLQREPGLSRARNAGIAAAHGSIIAFVDDDVIAHPGWLEALAKIYRSHPDAWCVGGKILLKLPGTLPRWFGPHSVTLMSYLSRLDLGDAAVKRDYPDAIWGANFSVRRDVLERVGLFDTALGPVGRRHIVGEETDLCWRIQRAGGGVYYCGDAVVTHVIPDARLTKRYFRAKAYWAGRTWRLHDREDLVAFYPRQLAGTVVRGVWNWIKSHPFAGAAQSRTAFEAELRSWLCAGFVYQRLVMAVARHPGPRPPRPRVPQSAASPPERGDSAPMGVDGRGIGDSSGPRAVGLQRTDEIPAPDGDLISWLARRAEDVVGSLVDPGARVALLDFPLYANVGDSAIWVGTRKLLRRLGIRVVYMADVDNYSPTRLARRLPRGTILLQGGGNFGDLWPLHQRFRESVIATFPSHRIIQLPQTLQFRRSETLVRAKSVLNRHPNLTLLVRDPPSLEFARREFDARSMLCPDLAAVIGRLARHDRPIVDIVALRRGDLEASGGFPDLPDAVSQHVDWTADPTGYAGRVRRAMQRLRGCAGTVGLVTNLLVHPYDLLARQRLAHGCRILSRGRAVLTDRLHGHIMSLLLGIPHVLLDDRYGKLRSFYETWTKGSALVSWADSPEHARALALSAGRAQGN